MLGEGDQKKEITLKHDFWMGKYPVTQALWQAVVGKNPSYFRGENRPVELVSWEDICEGKTGFLALLNQKENKAMALKEEKTMKIPPRLKPRRGEMIIDEKVFLVKVRYTIHNPEGMK